MAVNLKNFTSKVLEIEGGKRNMTQGDGAEFVGKMGQVLAKMPAAEALETFQTIVNNGAKRNKAEGKKANA